MEWLTMSVWTCSARLKRIARPRGLASAALSGIIGRPVELEKRAVTGVDGRETCGALVRDKASGAAVKEPVSISPLA